MTKQPPETPTSPTPHRFILITGMSGAGMSTALKAFEDIGYEAVDNLRLNLVPALATDDADKRTRSIAVAVDTRNASFSVDGLLRTRQLLSEKSGFEVKLIFLECSNETLQKRFTETRRRHPMAHDRPVTDGIKYERDFLDRLRDTADHVIDTSLMSIHDLRRYIAGHFRQNTSQGMSLFITSFAYNHGLPPEADMVLDVRFLRNPHYDPKLRPLTGQDPQIAAYVQKDPDYEKFFRNATELLLPLLPRYEQEGKSYFTIAVGCTGGRHRSVLLAEELATALAKHGHIVSIVHRELNRRGSN